MLQTSMIAIHCLLGEDYSIGRIDKHSFSQKTLLEMVFAGVTNMEKLCETDISYGNIALWNGVYLNKKRDIFKISMTFYKLKGSVALEWLPSTIRDVYLNYNHLLGTLSLTQLPERTIKITVAQNKLSGPINLKNLPPLIKILYLDSNSFSGYVDLSQLPSSLQELNLADNAELTGEVHHFYGTHLVVKNTNIQDKRIVDEQ